MSYFLVFTFILSLLSVFFVWYITRCANYIPDDTPLKLDSAEDKLLVHWYKNNIKYYPERYNSDLTTYDMAVKYLKHLYNIDIPPDLIVISPGDYNLDFHYHELTNLVLSTSYSPNIDCFFDIRSVLGVNCEIAIIHDKKIRSFLKSIIRDHREGGDSNIKLSDVNSIINSELHFIARDYISDLLHFRWTKILGLHDSTKENIINSQGSFLYLKHSPDTPLSSDSTINVFGNVIALATNKGARINLLCSNYEFEALIKRWKSVAPTDSFFPSSSSARSSFGRSGG